MNGNIPLRDRTPSLEKWAPCDPAVCGPRPFARAFLVGLTFAFLALNVLGAVMVIFAQQPHETAIHTLAAD